MWKPIDTAPLDRTILARDENDERYTYFQFGDWNYEGIRENEDQEEYSWVECWFPTEWYDI